MSTLDMVTKHPNVHIGHGYQTPKCTHFRWLPNRKMSTLDMVTKQKNVHIGHGYQTPKCPHWTWLTNTQMSTSPQQPLPSQPPLTLTRNMVFMMSMKIPGMTTLLTIWCACWVRRCPARLLYSQNDVPNEYEYARHDYFTHQMVCMMSKKMPGTTRSSDPTDHRLLKTTIPGMLTPYTTPSLLQRHNTCATHDCVQFTSVRWSKHMAHLNKCI